MEDLTEDRATEEQQKAERDKLRMEKKAQDASRPGSVVLAPKARDVWLLARMIISFDTGINHMRISAGTRIPLDKLAETSERVNVFIQSVKTLMRALGAASYYGAGFALESPELKRFLATVRSSIVFFPKTPEGETVANLIRELDSAFCEFKVKSPLSDITKLASAIGRMKDIVRDFHDLTQDITKLTNTRFREPEGYNTYIKPGGDLPGSESSKAAEAGV